MCREPPSRPADVADNPRPDSRGSYPDSAADQRQTHLGQRTHRSHKLAHKIWITEPDYNAYCQRRRFGWCKHKGHIHNRDGKHQHNHHRQEKTAAQLRLHHQIPAGQRTVSSERPPSSKRRASIWLAADNPIKIRNGTSLATSPVTSIQPASSGTRSDWVAGPNL